MVQREFAVKAAASGAQAARPELVGFVKLIKILVCKLGMIKLFVRAFFG